MSTVDELGRLLGVLRSSLAQDLAPEVSTQHARHAAVEGVKLLNRIAADDAFTPAPELERRWTELRSALAALAGAADEPPVPAIEEIGRVRSLLNVLLDDQTFLAEVARPGTAAFAWLADAAAALTELLTEYERLVPFPAVRLGVENTVPGDGMAEPDELRDRLARYLADRFPELGPEPITSWRLVPGGKAKKTAIFRVTRPELFGSEELALRCDFSTQTGTTTADEFPLLAWLHERGVKVPRPFLVEGDPAHLGGTFIVVEALSKAVNGGDFFPELREEPLSHALAVELVGTFGKLHSLTDSPLATTAGTGTKSPDPVERIAAYYDYWREYDYRPPLWLATELAFVWVRSRRLPPGRPQSVVHGDVGPHNVMVDAEGRLAGVLDWELAHLGDPAEDIGFCRAVVIEDAMSHEEFLEHYLGAGGTEAGCDPRAVDFFAIWGWLRSSIFATILSNYVRDGSRTDLECASTYRDQGDRVQYYLARDLVGAITREAAAAATTAGVSR